MGLPSPDSSGTTIPPVSRAVPACYLTAFSAPSSASHRRSPGARPRWGRKEAVSATQVGAVGLIRGWRCCIIEYPRSGWRPGGCMKREALMPGSTRRREERGRRNADTPHPVDVHIGARVRLRRIELGITQAKLAAELGLTIQQVYKYERATNRISASRLFRIGKALGVNVASFYEGYEEAGTPSG